MSVAIDVGSKKIPQISKKIEAERYDNQGATLSGIKFRKLVAASWVKFREMMAYQWLIHGLFAGQAW